MRWVVNDVESCSDFIYLFLRKEHAGVNNISLCCYDYHKYGFAIVISV